MYHLKINLLFILKEKANFNLLSIPKLNEFFKVLQRLFYTFEKKIIMEFRYIQSDITILGGKPCIQGTRISVDMILEWVASGASVYDIVKTYPHLKIEAVKEAVLYASRFLRNEVVIESHPSV